MNVYSRFVGIHCQESLAQSSNVLVSVFNISNHADVQFHIPLCCAQLCFLHPQEEDVICMPVSANSFVEFIVGVFFWLIVPFLVRQTDHGNIVTLLSKCSRANWL